MKYLVITEVGLSGTGSYAVSGDKSHQQPTQKATFFLPTISFFFLKEGNSLMRDSINKTQTGCCGLTVFCSSLPDKYIQSLPDKYIQEFLATPFACQWIWFKTPYKPLHCTNSLDHSYSIMILHIRVKTCDITHHTHTGTHACTPTNTHINACNHR